MAKSGHLNSQSPQLMHSFGMGPAALSWSSRIQNFLGAERRTDAASFTPVPVDNDIFFGFHVASFRSLKLFAFQEIFLLPTNNRSFENGPMLRVTLP
jgi:hypothetical protein